MTGIPTTHRLLQDIWAALDGDAALLDGLTFTGTHSYPCAFGVDDLMAASVAAAALAGADYLGSSGRAVTVDRRLVSLWFGWSFSPQGWTAPPSSDPVTGDYEAADGWIRLHTNARHHLAAALTVLGAPPDRTSVATAVRRWVADDLEAAIVAAGGAAATMRPMAAWAAHPQGQAVAAEPLVWFERTAAEPGPGPVDPTRPLAGLRVLDLTRVFAGPVCTRFLAGLGADVLRIDPPGWDEPGNEPEMTLGKRCARLDARSAEGRAQLAGLLARADVLVHGYRRAALDSIGFGAAERARIRPGLIDVSLDAYGWTGPWAGRRGFDSLVQMSSGIAEEGMRRFGTPGPKPLPVQALDHAAGYIMAAAVLRGLAERRAGHGWRARTSLARVAALLATTRGEGDLHGASPGAQAEDQAPMPETTVWGPLRRLRSPVAIAGLPLQWGLPACPLGSAPAQW
ncbi:CoA transferase [Bosea sp. 124]|uniref:CoA transferase n=1 Tax=Bosea sp. 124 TaxID=2135642 RepID=UPI000D3B7C65|nr:CoA transferase [Bosea sp. 124]PTM39033.1 CoA transferase family III [Bosea sp. 124]